jgi:2-polyprenyl-3-methyl-5-hydroxy-6-metoxy-1,4-benzoquinol methylase
MLDKKCWDNPWPENELEKVSLCPVCSTSDRKLLHKQLVDNVFFVADGKWDLYQCSCCKSAYLDPRPDQSSIHKAYSTYYTHETAAVAQKPVAQFSKSRKLRRMLANGYRNYHHGTERTPSQKLGALLLLFYPRLRKKMNAEYRYLHTPQLGQSLLDVGCGNGDFLYLAAEVGWNVKGVDPDPKALAVARSQGRDVVKGGIEQFSDSSNLFDVITMSHVIEHVHDPVDLVSSAYRLLKPGGLLYIDTPNIESKGAIKYRKNWRGLETPRHFIIFSKDGLFELISKIGFEDISFKSRSVVRKNLALRSHRMQLGKSPFDTEPSYLPLMDKLLLSLPRTISHEEFLTVLAYKSH